MYRKNSRWVFLLITFLVLGFFSSQTMAMVKGIYLTQGTAEDTTYLKYLIRQAQATGINTFVVDVEIPSKRLQTNTALIKDSHLTFVARVVVFPDGGKPEQIASPAYWEKRYRLVKTAVSYGADQVQLDYIRYSVKQKASSENAKNILKVVRWYKNKLDADKIPLQVDVFGIASFGESKNIGQNISLFADSIDAICPMVYPSHFDPYIQHAKAPYETIYKSLKAVQAQFDNKPPIKIYAYIELSNYRYPLSGSKRTAYIQAQIRAVKDAKVDGWFAWSAHNKYEYLFNLLDAENNAPKDPLHKVIEAHTEPVEMIEPEETTAVSFNRYGDALTQPLETKFTLN